MDTGIIRRIDDLGRVVIPKEIRKVLRIKEGEPLQIIASNDQLVLKKYSPVKSILNVANIVGKGLEETTEMFCIITDNDKIVYANNKLKDLKEKDISKEVEEIIKSRKSKLIIKQDGGEVIDLIKSQNLDAENQIIIPIINCGDCFGAVILFDKEKGAKLSNNEVKLARLGAFFIAEQFTC